MARSGLSRGWHEEHDLGSEGLHPALVALRQRALEQAGGRPAEARAGRSGRGALQRTAVAVSHAVSPPVTAVAAFVLLAAREQGARTWLWTGVELLLVVVAPLVALALMLRRGEVDDLEVTDRRQREAPMLLTLLCSWFALFVLDRAGAPAAMRELSLVYALLALWLQVITRRFKISVHAAGVAVFGTLVWSLTGSPAWLAVGWIVVGAARLVLGRHTPAEVVAGGMLGAGLVAIFAGGFTGI
ncbi:MAG TPA: phosphatase PAP2 family protein [Candidatus Krumholzibacteria bacterium]|nr:phosphatase PAP2 family protein [Candidatus Krumholzibacteria bacterium]